MNIPDSKIAVTLYNLRDYCRDEKGLLETLRKVRAIGYEAVQISGIGDIPASRVRSCLDETGLYCCATHEGLAAFLEKPDETIEKLKTYNCTFSAIGGPGNEYFREGGAEELAEKLNGIGARFLDAGIRFGYHNHDGEFEKFSDGTFMDVLFARSDAKTVCFEIDTHWVQRGGANPAAWVRKSAGRIPVLHIKDFSMIGRDPVFSEIGEGNLEWSEIFAAAEESGVRWYSVEQDKPFKDRNIFDSMEISFKNLRAMGVQ
ncbi:MAG: sugar phosphate isomerase/epimerase [Spirochaetales bacterium]|jgi:sugar phosphate isomerase/epimerase|nr:sugar phosphate isomerase/epimerase [Spirochaetales bacterium]